MKFRVTVEHIERYVKTVEVEADNEGEAREKAEQEVSETNFFDFKNCYEGEENNALSASVV